MRWFPIDAPIKGRLMIVSRPESGDGLRNDLADLKQSGVDLLVSLLEPAEQSELGLEREAQFCISAGLEFRSFPIADRGIPEPSFARFAQECANEIVAGRAMAIHCRAGIGRSGLAAAAILICAGIDAALAVDAISRARGLVIPDTEGQSRWIAAFRAGVSCVG
ncbi:MAG TPA: hypothetical protein VIM02_05475 [Rhizomicrobium sp.]|jgi:protein-tyrosine phosphatase